MKNFYAAYGYAPWECRYCGDLVIQIGRGTWDGNVHHLDEDVTNDEPENLTIAHAICHQRQHSPDEEMKRRISEKLKGRPSPTKGMKFSPESNVRKSQPGELNPFHGKRHTDEALIKMSQPRKRILCNDCGRDWAVNWIERHKREGQCVS